MKINMRGGTALVALMCAAAVSIMQPHARAAEAEAQAEAGRPKLQAKADIVIRDPARGDYLVWLDAGVLDGVSPGLSFDIIIKGKPAGTVWIEEALDHTSAGYISTIKGSPNITPGQQVTLIKKDIQAIQLYPEIKLPPKGIEIPAVPEGAANSSEKSLLKEFLKWSKKTRVPIGTLVPAENYPRPGAEDAASKKPDASRQLFEYEIVYLEPDIATEVKSGYFIEEGDCVHVAPWPESDDGRAVVIDKGMKLNYPGAAMFSTKGKTLLSLEKGISDYLRDKGEPSKVEVSPCKVKTPMPAEGR